MIKKIKNRLLGLTTMRTVVGYDSLQNMCNSINGTSNMTMIEIGCYTGESTSFWCNHFLKVFAIDPWIDGKGYDDKDIASIKMSNFVEAEFDSRLKKFDNFEKIKNFSYNVVDKFEDESIDFIYIDGEHTYEGVKRDIELYQPKIKKGGYIAGHDYKPKWTGVIKAVDEVLGTPDKVFQDSSWIKRNI
jgi:predicted O-methyltransferase YrrM